MKNIAFFPLCLSMLLLMSCNQQSTAPLQGTDVGFTFAFITDLHLQPEREAVEGTLQAIDTINRINPDFVITGGDLIMDALGKSWERADSLYKLYDATIDNLKVPVYNTMGNHEIYGIYNVSGADRNHPEFGEKIFEKRIGRKYYSFDHKGWHFMIIDSVDETEEGNAYEGNVGEEQMEWIREDLKNVDASTPIIISTHIPMATVFHNITSDPLKANAPNIVIRNTPEVLELFENHNLKLVLQGHMHILEEIEVNGVTFITAGAISGRWWTGPYLGVEEGFVLVHTHGDDFTWEYVDYGWHGEKYRE
ncbi:MAG: metallophosphoesterase family protein [Bacteroidota bacterium]